MEKELIAKIVFNNSSPKDYRKMGQRELLDTNPRDIYKSLLAQGYGSYKETANVSAERMTINEGVLRKREARMMAEATPGDEEKARKR